MAGTGRAGELLNSGESASEMSALRVTARLQLSSKGTLGGAFPLAFPRSLPGIPVSPAVCQQALLLLEAPLVLSVVNQELRDGFV